LAKNEIEVAAVDPIASMMAVENRVWSIATEIENSNGPLPLCIRILKN
jgi:hypothetical protein